MLLPFRTPVKKEHGQREKVRKIEDEEQVTALLLI
jgi:hypothetical protein